jgi:hypothetical protein
MSRQEEEFEPIGDEPEQYVPAVFAHSAAEAEFYRDLLKDHEIPAVLGTEDEVADAERPIISRGVPVLVPDAFLEEASEVIADREDLDEYDDELEDEDDEDEEEELELADDTEDDEDLDDEEEDEDEEEEENDEDEDEEDEFVDDEEEEEEDDEEEGAKEEGDEEEEEKDEEEV